MNLIKMTNNNVLSFGWFFFKLRKKCFSNEAVGQFVVCVLSSVESYFPWHEFGNDPVGQLLQYNYTNNACDLYSLDGVGHREHGNLEAHSFPIFNSNSFYS